jgi:hypothetical protein
MTDKKEVGNMKRNYKLQNTNYNQKFLQGGPGGALFSKSAPLAAGGDKQ